MGLFDRFRKSAPSPIQAQASPATLCAPMSGRVIAMDEVPDPVFSEGMLGSGCAVWPSHDVVYAPCSGTVTVAMGHAVAMTADDGAEVLVHVGVDTVSLNGQGFTGYVKQGDHVAAGQPLIKIDRPFIAEKGLPDCVVLAVSNTADFADVRLAQAVGTTALAGQPLLELVS